MKQEVGDAESVYPGIQDAVFLPVSSGVIFSEQKKSVSKKRSQEIKIANIGRTLTAAHVTFLNPLFLENLDFFGFSETILRTVLPFIMWRSHFLSSTKCERESDFGTGRISTVGGTPYS